MSDPSPPPRAPATTPDLPPVTRPAPAAPTAAAPWQSLLLTLAVLFVFFVAQGVAMLMVIFAYALARGRPTGNVEALILDNMGWSFSIATLLAAPFAVALAAGGLYVLARARGGPPLATVRRHLGLGRPRWPAFVFWAAATAAYVWLYDVVGDWFERPPLPEFMVAFHASGRSVWLLAAAVAVGAPLVEETLFRGVLLPGFAVTARLRGWGLVLSAALWAVIHAQYDLYDMTGIFVLGLLFGAARLHSRSLWTPLVLHAGFNLYAIWQLVALLGPIP